MEAATLLGLCLTLRPDLVAMRFEDRPEVIRGRLEDRQSDLEEKADQIGLIQFPSLTDTRDARVILIGQLNRHALVRLLAPALRDRSIDDLFDELMMHFTWRRSETEAFTSYSAVSLGFQYLVMDEGL